MLTIEILLLYAQLQAEIQKERDTRVQIAQAESSKQGVVVNAGK